MKQEIVHKIQSGIVGKEMKGFKRPLGKETAELFLEEYAEKHGRLTIENLKSLLSHLHGVGMLICSSKEPHSTIISHFKILLFHLTWGGYNRSASESFWQEPPPLAKIKLIQSWNLDLVCKVNKDKRSIPPLLPEADG